MQFRDKIEKSIIKGDYDSALEMLEVVKCRLGVSIWYYETKLLIYSYSGNEKKSLELLTEINKAKKDAKHGCVTFLLSYLYKRCSKSYSAFAYDSELENKFKPSRTEFRKDRYSYYLFRLNFYKSFDSLDLSPTLIMEATNSLIDRYNVFVNLIKAYFVQSKSKDNNERRNTSLMALKFYRKTNDRLLAPLVAYTNVKHLSSEYYNRDFIEILDLYYRGDYLNCSEKCKEFAETYNIFFDVLKIYSRSIIALGKDYSSICSNKDSILNQIACLLYETMTKSENEDYLNALYQIDKNIYGLELACGLEHYLLGDNKETWNFLKYLSLTIYDPKFCEAFDDVKDKNNYLSCGLLNLGSFSVLDYQTKRIAGDVGNTRGIAKYITDVDSAKIAFDEKNYEVALRLWLIVLEENRDILPIVQCAIDYIFRCFIFLDRKQDAITFYVDNYLKGNAYTSRIKTSDVIDKMYKEKYKRGVKNGLDLQLFVFLNAVDEEMKSALLERFCSYKDVEQASDLINELSSEMNKNPKKVELYFFLLASGDILRHMLYVTSTKKMLEEQQKISQFLTTLTNSSRIEEYKTLNQEIVDAMIVYQNIRKIDESKIFVNQPALLKYELTEHEGLYTQFKKQFANSGPTNSYYIVNTNSEWTDINEDSTLIRTQVKFTNKAFVDSASQVFSVVRDKFLFSKFGLKTYLSTRIRHGVLEGALRAGYDGLHLLLKTEDNVYSSPYYWINKYGLSPTEQNDLMKMLKKFSRGVSNAIESFKENALQIKILDTDNGMFDFRLTPDDMCYATVLSYTRAEDYNHFCMLLMEYMLKMTNSSLKNIRKEINDNLKNTLNQLVDNLSQDIQVFSDRYFFQELNSSVITASTETLKSIAHIEKWFYLQDAKFENFSLGKQMQAVWQITAKMYPNIKPSVVMEGLQEDIVIKSEYVIHISDMLTIFYNNMFSYSRVERTRPFRISLEKEGDVVRLTFENNINEQEELLNARFNEMLLLENRLQMEGRSGLVKVKKIIKAELGCDQNQLRIKASQGKCVATVDINIKEICA